MQISRVFPGQLLAATLLASVAVSQAFSPVTAGGPGGRLGIAMARTSDCIVSFGGKVRWGGPFADTWSFDGQNWSPITTTNAPSGRQHHAMAYEPAMDRVLLFGGGFVSTQLVPHPLGDTWVFDPAFGAWTPLTSAPSPAARLVAAMATDTVRGKIVLFGGLTVDPVTLASVFLNDTWEWDATGGWVRVSPATVPPARAEAAMTFDSVRGRVVMHGGTDGTFGDLTDTWEFNGVDWVEVTPSCGGPGHRPHFAFCETTGTSILFGEDLDGSVWSWDGEFWRRSLRLEAALSGAGGGAATTSFDGRVVHLGGTVFPILIDNTTRAYGDPLLALAETFGCGCATSLGELRQIATTGVAPAMGTTFELALDNAVGSAGVVFALDALALPFDLAIFGAVGCQYYAGPTHVGTSLGSSIALQIPTNPALAGLELFSQGIAVDPSTAALATSNGMRLVVR